MANPNWVKGVSGNPKGPPRRPEIDLLRKALAKAKKSHGGVDFLDHFVDLAYTDHAVAIALAKKFLPDMRAEDITITSKTFADIVKDVMNARNARKSRTTG
jgi:hypothetical protein